MPGFLRFGCAVRSLADSHYINNSVNTGRIIDIENYLISNQSPTQVYNIGHSDSLKFQFGKYKFNNTDKQKYSIKPFYLTKETRKFMLRYLDYLGVNVSKTNRLYSPPYFTVENYKLVRVVMNSPDYARFSKLIDILKTEERVFLSCYGRFICDDKIKKFRLTNTNNIIVNLNSSDEEEICNDIKLVARRKPDIRRLYMHMTF